MSEEEGFKLYIPNINDELLLTKPLKIRIVVGGWQSRQYDGLVDVLGLQQQAYVDKQGNFVGKHGQNRMRVSMDLELPIGTYIRVCNYQIRRPWRRAGTKPGSGGMHFFVSGFTEELRAQLKIKRRKDCRNYGKFYLPIEYLSRIHYLPATEPEVIIES